MFARRLCRVKLNNCEGYGGIDNWWVKCSRLMSYEAAPNAGEEKTPRELKKWRAEWDTGKHRLQTRLKIFDRSSRPSTDFIVMMNAPWDLSREGISRWWKEKKREMEIHDQRFIQDRHAILGSNLAAAHFLVHRGAKVKFVGNSEWVEKDKDDEYDLPDKYTPGYILEAIDANGIDLYYEGLANMCNLHDLKTLSLKGCKTIDDWCMDRISNVFIRLEQLDVSNCKEVSERGLEALYRMQTLKTLIITNYYNSPAFELTCMMLEDCNPDLKIEIKAPETDMKIPKKN